MQLRCANEIWLVGQIIDCFVGVQHPPSRTAIENVNYSLNTYFLHEYIFLNTNFLDECIFPYFLHMNTYFHISLREIWKYVFM